MAQVPPVAAQVPPGPAKSYLVYDQYGLEQADGALVLFDDPGISITDFKQNHVMAHSINRNSVDRQNHNTPFLPGELGWRRHYVASEISKKFAKSLLKRLREIEAEGKCIEDFIEDQIRVVLDTGEVKLRWINTLSKADLGDALYEACLEANYMVARTTIRDLYMVVPADVRHLLNLMANHFGDRELFPYHACLEPLVLSPALFKDLHDMLQVKVTDPEYHAICHTVIGAFGANWRADVKQNELLKKTYYYNNQYELPSNRPNQWRLSQDQIDALNEVRLPINQHARVLTQYELDVIDGHKLLTFLRNRLAHRMEAIAAASKNMAQNYDFSSLHSELVTMVKFRLVLATIQYELHIRGYPRVVKLL